MHEKMSDVWIVLHQNKYRYWKFEKLRLVLITASLLFGFAYIWLRRQSLNRRSGNTDLCERRPGNRMLHPRANQIKKGHAHGMPFFHYQPYPQVRSTQFPPLSRVSTHCQLV